MVEAMIKGTKKGVVCGVGINDSVGSVSKISNGKQVKCKFYSVWKSMITRCYSKKYQSENQTYAGCTVCEEWLTFSNFKTWMEKQDFEGKQLDKDILVAGNKVYSPDACVFVNQMTNAFAADSRSAKRDMPIGVHYDHINERYVAQCSNPLTGGSKLIGHYSSKDSAHLAWKKKKHEISCIIAGMQRDKRVSDALMTRYL